VLTNQRVMTFVATANAERARTFYEDTPGLAFMGTSTSLWSSTSTV
jgi:hypothetical protein